MISTTLKFACFSVCTYVFMPVLFAAINGFHWLNRDVCAEHSILSVLLPAEVFGKTVSHDHLPNLCMSYMPMLMWDVLLGVLHRNVDRQNNKTPPHHRHWSTLYLECEKRLKMSGCLIDSCFTNCVPSLTDKEVFH